LKLSLHPDLYLGELYADGALIIERGTLWDLLELLGRNQLVRVTRTSDNVMDERRGLSDACCLAKPGMARDWRSLEKGRPPIGHRIEAARLRIIPAGRSTGSR
jgi:hypothetical protein